MLRVDNLRPGIPLALLYYRRTVKVQALGVNIDVSTPFNTIFSQ